MKPHLNVTLGVFQQGCARADGLRSISIYLKGSAPAALDCDDLLRSSIVLAVSALDLFVHDIYRNEVIYRFQQKMPCPTLKIPYDAGLCDGTEQIMLIDAAIRRENSFRSFVAPDKIAECLKPLMDNPWDLIADKLGLTAKQCKSRLKSIIDLRNRIAHDCDVNPDYGGTTLWPIYADDVEDSIIFIKSLGAAISAALNDIG